MTWHRSILTRLQLVHSAPMQHCKLLTGWLRSCVSCHTGQNTDLSSESAHPRASLGATYQSFVKKRCYGSPKTLMNPASSRSLSPESRALLLKQTLEEPPQVMSRVYSLRIIKTFFRQGQRLKHNARTSQVPEHLHLPRQYSGAVQ